MHYKHLVNIHAQYVGKQSGRTQFPAINIRFGFSKKCSDITSRLVEDPDFRCRRCLGNARAIDGKPCVEVQLADGKFDVVDNFVYHGDCIGPGPGGSKLILSVIVSEKTLYDGNHAINANSQNQEHTV